MNLIDKAKPAGLARLDVRNDGLNSFGMTNAEASSYQYNSAPWAASYGGYSMPMAPYAWASYVDDAYGVPYNYAGLPFLPVDSGLPYTGIVEIPLAPQALHDVANLYAV